MARERVHAGFSAAAWELVRNQHGVISRAQLLDLGLSSEAVVHRVSTGRLHPVARGIYAVGRPELSRRGHWLVAVLSCGPTAVLSHHSAAALWEIQPEEGSKIEVTVSPQVRRRRPGVTVHRRALEPSERTFRYAIPVTTAQRVLLDLATILRHKQLEAVVNEADKLDLVDAGLLGAELDGYSGRPGVSPLRAILDRHSFRLTDSDLERRFLAIARRAGLPLPETGRHLNGFKVDFYWPGIGLVVETDGLRYHRTSAQQARDRVRDNAHVAAGLTLLRFTNAQVRYQSDHVQSTLIAVAERLSRKTVGELLG